MRATSIYNTQHVHVRTQNVLRGLINPAALPSRLRAVRKLAKTRHLVALLPALAYERMVERVLDAQRDALLRMRVCGDVSNETMSRILRELDLERVAPRNLDHGPVGAPDGSPSLDGTLSFTTPSRAPER